MSRIKTCQNAIYMLSCFFVEESENLSNFAIIVFAKRAIKYLEYEQKSG